MMKEEFSWVTTHQELTEFLKTKENSQNDLIQILKDIGVSPLNDKIENNVTVNLEEIDPFTFYSYIYKYGPEKRLINLKNIANKLGLSIPNGQSGIPSAQPQKVWLFPYKVDRKNNEVSRLWAFFRKAATNTLSDEDFNDVIKIKGTGKTKLTEALFYIDPINYLPINGPTIPYIKEVLGLNPNFATFQEYVELLNKVRNKSSLTFYELSYEAWKMSQDSKGRLSKNEFNFQKYWLYAPGEKAYKWDEFYKQGIMGLGWDEIGDFAQYSSREEIKKALDDKNGKKGLRSNDVTAIDDFLNSMKIGDIIIAKKGRKEYLGYGIVSSDYIYDDKRENYKHCRKVNWIKTGNWKEVDQSIVLKTLTDVTIYTSYVEKLKKLIGIESIERNEKNEIMEYSLNTIFYGPPGTGKTYNTVLRAAEIVSNRKIESYDEALQIFNKNLHDRIEFITFHQNYSYEDFIQGLRPDTENESQQLRFEKKDGIFKIIADRALKNLTESSKAPEEISKEKRFELALENFIEDLNENEGIYKITENCQVYEVEADAFRYTGENWKGNGYGLRMKFNDLKEFYLNDIQIRKDIKLLSNISALAKRHSTYYFGVYQGILKFLKNENTQIVIETVQKNYVIIIDEINRANISRVFGELITLIEPDKRSNGEIPMEVILPSGDKFLVPSNLYIIGTMNTADKSIALLDIALRRRFEFEPMYPIDDREEIDGKRIFDVDVLKKLNEKIKEIKRYDIQIGHAYFMNEKETLVQRMNKKVIPLLLEYFMNDKQEVESILQYAGLKVEKVSWPLKISGRK